MFITFVYQIKFLHKLHSHVCYEKAYQCKKFQKFDIKILNTMTCTNPKKDQKMNQRILGIK